MLRVCGAWSAVAISWVRKVGSGRAMVAFRDQCTVWVTGTSATQAGASASRDLAVQNIF